MLFLFLERYNIFPCDGQIFISSLSVQTKSGKQAVLAQPSTFPNSSCINVLPQGSLAAAAAPHVQFAGPRCTDFSCNISPYVLEAFQTSNMPVSQYVSLLNPQWNCLRGVPDPNVSLQWDIKKYSWSLGMTTEQEN